MDVASTDVASMKVSDLTVQQLQELIRDSVEDALGDLLDPDRGLELTDEWRERLQRAAERNDRGIPIEEAAKRLGLVW